MTSPFRPARGMYDVPPLPTRRHRRIVRLARACAACYGFWEAQTPVLERNELFARSLGESSDVVGKEMFAIAPSRAENLALRPENTAGFMRAYLHGSWGPNPLQRLFYSGPMFRHERPQRGRLRQFHQFGVELLGADVDLAELEVIALGVWILQRLDLADHVRLEINTLGDHDSRAAYRHALLAYLQPHADKLSADSQRRLQNNPLRILDSKSPIDRALLENAPAPETTRSKESADRFERLQQKLHDCRITYVRNPYLVRGLDYYCETVFECTTDRLGSQGTLMAGGCYDGLSQSLGSDVAVPGVGWAAGVERIASLQETLQAKPHAQSLENAQENTQSVPPDTHNALPRPLVAICLEENLGQTLRNMVSNLRERGFAVLPLPGENLRKSLRRAARLHARAVLLLGEREHAEGKIRLRDMDSGTQQYIHFADLPSVLENMSGIHRPFEDEDG